MRKPRRTRINVLLNNNYSKPQNIRYNHVPSNNPSAHRKGEELLINTPSKVYNTLSPQIVDSLLPTFSKNSTRTNLSYSNQAALTALVWNASLLKLHSLVHSKYATIDDASLVSL